jgi:hypothetical protein
MAESLVTLSEIITVNDRNLADVDVPNFLDAAPFMNVGAAVTASHDTLHKWLRYVLPDVGFREPNDGREVKHSIDTLVTSDCEILDASFRTDLALAQSYRKGGDDGWVNREGARHLRAAFFEAEKQVFLGLANDSGGFPGFPDATHLDGLAAPHMVVSAGGTTAAVQTSAYLVRFGPEDVEIIMGRSGQISIGDPTIQETAGATGTYPALYVPVTAWLGLKIGSTVGSVVRIANIEGGFDDDHIAAAYAKFPADRKPQYMFANAAALTTLRASRTATNGTGTPAPFVDSVFGMTVLQSDAIGNTEALVA